MFTVVNTEEVIGKTVGRRTKITDPLAFVTGMQKSLAAWNLLRIRKGVYRFHSHEEADQWLMDHLTRKRAN